MRPLLALAVPILCLTMLSSASAQNSAGWAPYTDSSYGFSAELPLELFEVVDAAGSPGVVLHEIGGQATVNLHGGPAKGMTPEALEALLETGEQIRNITYKAGDASWFVLSGHYDGTGSDTIFYTKVLFSPDHRTFSAFEITFPAKDKPRFEALVEHFEDNFTRPRP